MKNFQENRVRLSAAYCLQQLVFTDKRQYDTLLLLDCHIAAKNITKVSIYFAFLDSPPLLLYLFDKTEDMRRQNHLGICCNAAGLT